MAVFPCFFTSCWHICWPKEIQKTIAMTHLFTSAIDNIFDNLHHPTSSIQPSTLRPHHWMTPLQSRTKQCDTIEHTKKILPSTSAILHFPLTNWIYYVLSCKFLSFRNIQTRLKRNSPWLLRQLITFHYDVIISAQGKCTTPLQESTSIYIIVNTHLQIITNLFSLWYLRKKSVIIWISQSKSNHLNLR